jgi:hypothetical protein
VRERRVGDDVELRSAGQLRSFDRCATPRSLTSVSKAQRVEVRKLLEQGRLAIGDRRGMSDTATA